MMRDTSRTKHINACFTYNGQDIAFQSTCMPSLPTDIHGNKAYDIGSLAAKQHVSVHSSNGEANSELMRSCSPISAGHPQPKRSPRPKRLPTADHQSLFAMGASKRETLSITIELIELFTISLPCGSFHKFGGHMHMNSKRANAKPHFAPI